MTVRMFSCRKCGECCRVISHIDELKELQGINGHCIHLVANLCSIYSERPNLCRGDYVFGEYFQKHMSYQEFLKLSESFCESIRTGSFKKQMENTRTMA